MRYLLALAALLVALPAHAVTMEWVTVGDPGNAGDGASCWNPPCGAVPYRYRIGKYEVTNAQYAEFLNAVAASDTEAHGLYHTAMGSGRGGITRSGGPGSYSYSTIPGRENMPVLYVSFFDALRFVNWLHNGQPSGSQDATTTEDGAYTFSDLWIVGLRNPGAGVVLPTENEWYKAAYYDAASLSYFDYPTGSDTPPTCASPGPTANTANCGQPWIEGDVTEVGSYTGSASRYGTFDQGGNVREWLEDIVQWERALRGGCYWAETDWLAAWHAEWLHPTLEADMGFRVVMIRECDDGLDNDGDGFTDYPADPGCAELDDLSERSPLLPCDDGVDNDSDSLADYPEDPGCRDPIANVEDPACQDGQDNDGDTLIDFDGGLSALGYVAADADPNCVNPYKDSETVASSRRCGLGTELLLLLPPLMKLARRRRRRS